MVEHSDSDAGRINHHKLYQIALERIILSLNCRDERLPVIENPRWSASDARERWNPGERGNAADRTANRSGAGTGNGRSKSALTREKIALFAPMPSASDKTATSVTIGMAVSERIARRTSCMSGLPKGI
jgi:hypothetical protein